MILIYSLTSCTSIFPQKKAKKSNDDPAAPKVSLISKYIRYKPVNSNSSIDGDSCLADNKSNPAHDIKDKEQLPPNSNTTPKHISNTTQCNIDLSVDLMFTIVAQMMLLTLFDALLYS